MPPLTNDETAIRNAYLRDEHSTGANVRHEATAKRREAAGGVEWNAVCSCGWRLRDLGSERYAQTRANEHMAAQR